MTVREALDKYLDLFVLIMESAGEETGNSSYKNAARLIEGRKNMLQEVADEGYPFSMLVVMCISVIVIDVHGVDRLARTSIDDMDNYITSIWELYLKKPTRSFTEKNGLTPISDLEYSFVVAKKYIE